MYTFLILISSPYQVYFFDAQPHHFRTTSTPITADCHDPVFLQLEGPIPLFLAHIKKEEEWIGCDHTRIFLNLLENIYRRSL